MASYTSAGRQHSIIVWLENFFKVSHWADLKETQENCINYFVLVKNMHGWKTAVPSQVLISSFVQNGGSMHLALFFPSSCPVGFEDVVGASLAKVLSFLEPLFDGGRWRKIKCQGMSNCRKWQSQKEGNVSQWRCWVGWWGRPFRGGGPIWAGRSWPCWGVPGGLLAGRGWDTERGWL